MLGKVVTMKPAALQKKRENKNTVALDSEQNAIQVIIIDIRIRPAKNLLMNLISIVLIGV